jgi:hypothetical protein
MLGTGEYKTQDRLPLNLEKRVIQYCLPNIDGSGDLNHQILPCLFLGRKGWKKEGKTSKNEEKETKGDDKGAGNGKGQFIVYCVGASPVSEATATSFTTRNATGVFARAPRPMPHTVLVLLTRTTRQWHYRRGSRAACPFVSYWSGPALVACRLRHFASLIWDLFILSPCYASCLLYLASTNYVV